MLGILLLEGNLYRVVSLNEPLAHKAVVVGNHVIRVILILQLLVVIIVSIAEEVRWLSRTKVIAKSNKGMITFLAMFLNMTCLLSSLNPVVNKSVVSNDVVINIIFIFDFLIVVGITVGELVRKLFVLKLNPLVNEAIVINNIIINVVLILQLPVVIIVSIGKFV